MKKQLQEKKITLGVCYYPEQWPKSLWDDDFKRMKELEFQYVRMGEFAWTIFEPQEGQYSFELFDEAIECASRHGLKVILGTPTATPPAWLTHTYPDVLNASQNGVLYQHGMRRHYNYNSEIYRELCQKIVTEMVLHYKDHPEIVGWQIDNELNCEMNVFYSDSDHRAFRKWVQDKYKTLDQVNEAWGTVFWNQTYTEWEQIYLPRPTVQDSPNPHQALDEKRFISDSAISFAKLQADIIRREAPRQWVTTNGLFGHLNSHQLTDDMLDFFAYDSYPNFSTIFPENSNKPLLDRKWSWNLSIVRSISPNFAIFEQQSGPGGWVNRIKQPSPKPGQLRLWSYQSIAHGADMVLYFRWRTATQGSEIYWHGINDYHNLPNRRVDEVTNVSSEIQKVGEAIAGSIYTAEVAIVFDYDNEWDGELDEWHGPFAKASQQEWFKAFQYSHIPVDVLNLHKSSTLEDLQKYNVLIYPHPAIMTEQTAQLLEQFTENGGKIVFGCRSGYKKGSGQTYMKPFPGVLSKLTGITVDDFTTIGPFEEAPSIIWSTNDKQGTVEHFNETLTVQSDQVNVLARFHGTYYEGKSALTKHAYGKGSAYYLGGGFNLDIALMLLSELQLETPIKSMTLPEKVELAIRTKAGQQFIFLLNYAHQPQEIFLEEKMVDLLSGQTLESHVTMKPYDVYIFHK
ncbi:beta-galactosidase [Bacillus solitudinis]|uniref:beta-galactosidase n=1 Tax=Bacillus solitudinis TaxID=2014074 RepID=UPI000C23A489|nr:beta-galactosidase [Bacillus solitudinis]